MCLGNTHLNESVNVYKTFVMPNGRTSLLKPCENKFTVKEQLSFNKIEQNAIPSSEFDNDTIFERTTNDDKPGLSVEDRLFLQKMDKELDKDDNGNWVAPLPFKDNRSRLPDNRFMAMRRAKTFDVNLSKDSVKREHFLSFMQKLFDNGHAELAPPVKIGEEVWYLPIFGVYHPRKPDQIRGVFDSSASFESTSLNDVLLSGPDLNNSLIGVLLKFRMEPIAVTADIQQMFHCFYVRPDHRNFLRFFWHRDNDFKKELVEYRMKVHVFGNRPSPAVAIYGLHRTALVAEETFGSDIKKFVFNHFYVDDGLISVPTVDEAVDILKRTQMALLVHGNLRLHKFASSSKEVMAEFPSDDLTKDLKV